ncbi:MAG: immunity 22 family protein [Burkholderiales bacterium]|jgi:hypothetical protein|nr:immunity 22 family protein [Burkholderiales bacterium]
MIDTTTKNVISVWMGTSNKTTEEFNKYTEGLEDSNSNCPAHKEWGTTFIDTDLFVAYRTADRRVVPIEELVKEVGSSSKKTDLAIVKKAKEMGINEGNSLYYYLDATFHEEHPGSLYNGLKFIGTFPDPRKKYR